MTDDPLNSQDQIAVLQPGQANCYYLATLDETWAYIQAETADGQVYRGFVSINDFLRIQTTQETQHVMQDSLSSAGIE